MEENVNKNNVAYSIEEEVFGTNNNLLESTEMICIDKTDQTVVYGNAQQRKEMFKDWVGYIGEIKNPETTADNKYISDKNRAQGGKPALYAPLDEVLNTTRPVLSKYGFALTQVPTSNENTASVQTILLHRSGAMISFPKLTVPISANNNAQMVIAGITYARRGALNPILATHGEYDDDGNEITNTPQKQTVKPAETKAKATHETKPATSNLTPEQNKVIDIANELVAKLGYTKAEVNAKLGLNPREETDATKLNTAYNALLEMKKAKTETPSTTAKVNINDL